MRNNFEHAMEELKAEIIQMSGIIESTISRAMHALKESDFRLAREVAENDDYADQLELSIERRALRILLSQQPVAADLRTISTSFKMITDMERICDQAADIAEIVLNFEGTEMLKKPTHIMKMAENCVIMTSRAIDSFVTADLALAHEVIAFDDVIDDLFIQIREELVEIIAKNPQNGGQAMDFLMIAKYLERIGDHAQNISEWCIFNITGEHKSQRVL
ncbi:MAG: phosphate signaling complex protein PhoU [Clostridia bacterium]